MIDRDAPGFAEAMRAEALRHTPMGILTRGVSGIAGRIADRQLPGQPEGDRRAVRSDRADARARRRDAAARGWPANPRPLSCAGSRATSASGPRCEMSAAACRPARRSRCWGATAPGKSTLLRILATLLRPHAGEVLVFGEPLPRRAFAVRGPARPARPRAAAVPRADRAREPRVPRAPAPRRPGARRGGPGARSRWSAGPRSRSACSPAAWSSGSRSAAPCFTRPGCCCSTSPAPTSTRRAGTWWSR